MILISIIIVLLIAAAVCTCFAKKDKYYDMLNNWGVVAIICVVFAIILGIIGGCLVLEYYEFMHAFENMRAYYESIDNELLNSEVYSVVDMLEANRELIQYQSSREFWGCWGLVPEEMLNIAPIGAN